MKGQVAFEYIVIVGLVFLLLIPVWSYMASVNSQASEALYISQAETAARKIVSAADLVYTQGPPTQLTIDAYIPRQVESVVLLNTTVRFRLYSAGSVTDVAATSLGTLSGSLPSSEGLYKFTIKAVDNYVNISY